MKNLVQKLMDESSIKHLRIHKWGRWIRLFQIRHCSRYLNFSWGHLIENEKGPYSNVGFFHVQKSRNLGVMIKNIKVFFQKLFLQLLALCAVLDCGYSVGMAVKMHAFAFPVPIICQNKSFSLMIFVGKCFSTKYY